MKNLKKFIKESIKDMLTFKDGYINHSNEPPKEVSARDRVMAMQMFAQSESSDFSYEYHYESVGHPEGVLVTCIHSGKTYLVTHGNPGHVVRYSRR